MAKRRVNRNLAGDVKRGKARAAHREMGVNSIYPLNAPGMPPPGPDFLEQARRIGGRAEVTKKRVKMEDGTTQVVTDIDTGDKIEELHRRAIREPGFTMPVQVKAALRKNVSFVPGHIWGQHIKEFENGDYIAVDGPAPAEVMVIGKLPGSDEERYQRCLVGETGRIFLEALRNLRVKGTARWYVTNLLKFRPPDGSTTIKASWLKDCMPLLHQELRMVRPKYILCLGADASKALLGTRYNVSYMENRVMELDYPVDLQRPADPKDAVNHTSMVMTIVHPASVSRAPDMQRTFERGLSRFKMLLDGVRFDREEHDIDHRWITNLDDLKMLLKEINNDPEKTDDHIAVDAEWHGEHPVNNGAYVRTIQLAWRPKHGAALILNDTEGKCCFFDSAGKPAIKRAMKLLNKFFKNKRVGGHFFVADLEWLDYLGLDEVKRAFDVPLYACKVSEMKPKVRKKFLNLGMQPDDMVPAWMRTKYEGGWDTGLRGHAIEETAMLGLEGLVCRYTDTPRYDVPLHDWKVQYCKDQGIKSKDLEGYGPCPDDILVPYGIYDADATLRLFYAQERLIDNDYDGNCCREPAWEAQITALPILEMHQTGLGVDKGRIDTLTQDFMEARERMENKIQTWAKWPDFNIRSVMQVREFLFGTKYNGKKDKTTGKPVRIRPEGAKSLGAEPEVDTSKPPKSWEYIRENDLEDEHNVGTSKVVLGVMAQDPKNEDISEQIQWIRDYRFLDQVLKSLLRPPKVGADGEWVYEEDADDSWAQGLVFDAGLASVICDDGRVRTHLYPTTETGRWRSARPNLQNISKRRDADYERMLGKDKYKHKLRSILKAPPGCVYVEADYIGAELYGMAIMSGDANMIEHAKRNQLPDEGYDEFGAKVKGGKFPHPEFYDIHSNVAKLAFNLDCEPTKAALKALKLSHLRIVAKSVIFGIAYGRGAKAIAFEARQEGIDLTIQEAQDVIDTIFKMYPGLTRFFEDCKRRVEAGWLCNCFGRYRRFPQTDNFKMAGEFERQAQNYPIQSMIASVMDRAIAYIRDYRNNVLERPDLFNMVLQIHDAVVLEVPCENVPIVVNEVLPYCMRDMCPIYPAHLDGRPIHVNEPHYLGIDTEIVTPWGEKPTREYAEQYGLDLKYAADE